MTSLTRIVYYWTSWSSLSYNQASVPGLTFESMSSKAHQAHIVLNESMTSIVQQSFGSCPTSSSLNPYYNPTFGSLTLCHVLSGGRQRQVLSPEKRWLFLLPASWDLCVSSPPDQAVKRRVCVLTTIENRRSGIQPTAVDPAQLTNQSLLLFSFNQLFLELTSENLPRPPLVSSIHP